MRAGRRRRAVAGRLLRFSPDGARLVSIGHDAWTVELWEAATVRQVVALKIDHSRGAAFHPTERTLVVVAGTTVHVVEDGDWLFAPDTHDRGLRILHVRGGKSFTVLRGEGPFYKAMALARPASLVALLRPGDAQGAGPYGLEVWRLTYRAK